MSWKNELSDAELAKLEDGKKAIASIRQDLLKIRKRGWRRMLVKRSSANEPNTVTTPD